MADGVQATLDTMVPALRDLLSKGIFSETEIRSIVKRRRQYEYLLRRRQARKADYFRYIDDEVKLERLRSLRNRKLLARKAFEESEHRKGRTVESRAKEAGSSNGDARILVVVYVIFGLNDINLVQVGGGGLLNSLGRIGNGLQHPSTEMTGRHILVVVPVHVDMERYVGISESQDGQKGARHQEHGRGRMISAPRCRRGGSRALFEEVVNVAELGFGR